VEAASANTVKKSFQIVLSATGGRNPETSGRPGVLRRLQLLLGGFLAAAFTIGTLIAAIIIGSAIALVLWIAVVVAIVAVAITIAFRKAKARSVPHSAKPSRIDGNS